jgi:putative N-acetylmannosamine-6-phosphate epimerase
VTCWTTVSFAAFSLPPEVYRIGSLKDVQDKAKSINVPIVFVYSDENTACGLAKTATLDVIQELKKMSSLSMFRDTIRQVFLQTL